MLKIISPEAQVVSMWLLNESAYILRGLVRVNEAIDPVRAALEMSVSQADWINAPQVASTLSELELDFCDVKSAVHDAEQSLIHAERSGIDLPPFNEARIRSRFLFGLAVNSELGSDCQAPYGGARVWGVVVGSSAMFPDGGGAGIRKHGGREYSLTCVHDHARDGSGKLKSGNRLLAATRTLAVNSRMSW